MRVHKIARLKHLPTHFSRFQRFNARVVSSALQLVEYRPVQLLEHQKDAIVFPEDFKQIHDMVMFQLL